jgi:hypothetical protein
MLTPETIQKAQDAIAWFGEQTAAITKHSFSQVNHADLMDTAARKLRGIMFGLGLQENVHWDMDVSNPVAPVPVLAGMPASGRKPDTVERIGPALLEYLAGIDRKLDCVLSLLEKVITMSDTVQNELNALTAAVANETTIDQSAVTLIQGIPALIQAAVNAALAEGATPTQLASFSALNAQLQQNATALQAAVTANTPAPQAPASVAGGASATTVTGGAS